jgi:hypothetical protein
MLDITKQHSRDRDKYREVELNFSRIENDKIEILIERGLTTFYLLRPSDNSSGYLLQECGLWKLSSKPFLKLLLL